MVRSGEMSSNSGGLIRWPAMLTLPLGFSLVLLQAISEILGVPVSFLFEDAPGQEGIGRGFAEDPTAGLALDFAGSTEGLQLNRAFVRIHDPKVRRKVIELVKALAPDDG